MRLFPLLVACLYAPLLTYAADGQPYWYFIDGQWQGESGQFELVEYRRVNGAATLAQRFPGARIERVAAAPRALRATRPDRELSGGLLRFPGALRGVLTLPTWVR